MEIERTSTAGQVMGIIGIVLGVISLIVAFIPCVGVVAFIPGTLAVIFSIISIVQATKGYGSKGLGIGALIVSLVAILLAALWLALFSGATMVANKAIKDSGGFEQIGREFERAFEQELEEDIDMNAVTDSLEEALRQLELEMDQLDENTPEHEKARKAGEVTAKALKKAAEGLKAKEKADSLKNQ